MAKLWSAIGSRCAHLGMDEIAFCVQLREGYFHPPRERIGAAMADKWQDEGSQMGWEKALACALGFATNTGSVDSMP